MLVFGVVLGLLPVLAVESVVPPPPPPHAESNADEVKSAQDAELLDVGSTIRVLVMQINPEMLENSSLF